MLALLICILIVFLDQATKEMIRNRFVFQELVEVIPGFMNLTYLKNTGAAWGMFGQQNISLTVLSVVMLIVMVVFRRSFLSDTLCHKVALGLLAGGIIGNLIDRIKFQAVTDFLDFYIGSWHWPSFNVADSAICVGVGIYIVTTMLDSIEQGRKHYAEER